MMLQEKGEMSIAIKKLTPFPTTYPLIQKFFLLIFIFYFLWKEGVGGKFERGFLRKNERERERENSSLEKFL